MPGKYSHSVVLANYSTRGLIVLPPDQNDKYKKALNSEEEKAESLKLRSRSAQASYFPPVSSTEGWDSLTNVKSLPALAGPQPKHSQQLLEVPLNLTNKEKRRSRRLQHYQQPSYSSPAVNEVPNTGASTAYQRQQQRMSVAPNNSERPRTSVSPRSSLVSSNGTPNARQLSYSAITIPLESADESTPAYFHHKATAPDSSQQSAKQTRALSAARPANGASQAPKSTSPEITRLSQTHKASTPIAKPINELETEDQKRNKGEGRSTPDIWRCDVKRNRGEGSLTPDIWRCDDKHDKRNRGEGSSTPDIWRCPPPDVSTTGSAKTDLGGHARVGTFADSVTIDHEVKMPKANSAHKAELGKVLQQAAERFNSKDDSNVMRTISNDSMRSRNTQIWNPHPILEEPDFDGFTDFDSDSINHFQMPEDICSHSRESSTNSTLPIQRPGSDDSERYVNEATPTVSPQRTRDSASLTTAASTTASSSADRSNSSASSLSVINGYSHNTTTSKTAHGSVGNAKWNLPEIREDHGFSPSIFEDKESGMDKLDLDLDFARSIGQISSGKDVMFDNDAASELSAALPPPITRFKDDEAEFNANMTRIFGEGGDLAGTKKAGSTLVRRASQSRTRKSKSFFSIFRSKN